MLSYLSWKGEHWTEPIMIQIIDSTESWKFAVVYVDR